MIDRLGLFKLLLMGMSLPRKYHILVIYLIGIGKREVHVEDRVCLTLHVVKQVRA